jgi:hypothetical protein
MKLTLVVTEEHFRDLVAGKTVTVFDELDMAVELYFDPPLNWERMTRLIAIDLGVRDAHGGG